MPSQMFTKHVIDKNSQSDPLEKHRILGCSVKDLVFKLVRDNIFSLGNKGLFSSWDSAEILKLSQPFSMGNVSTHCLSAALHTL